MYIIRTENWAKRYVQRFNGFIFTTHVLHYIRKTNIKKKTRLERTGFTTRGG